VPDSTDHFLILLTRSNPLELFYGHVAFDVASVECCLRLKHDELAFLVGMGLMLDTLRDNEHLAFLQADLLVSQVDTKKAIIHDKELVGLFVLVPDEISLKLHNLDQVIVDLPDDFWRPVFGEEREFAINIDWLQIHGTILVFDIPSRFLSTLQGMNEAAIMVTLLNGAGRVKRDNMLIIEPFLPSYAHTLSSNAAVSLSRLEGSFPSYSTG
jgi:hypothetical protein